MTQIEPTYNNFKVKKQKQPIENKQYGQEINSKAKGT